jgi:hypothetical protein
MALVRFSGLVAAVVLIVSCPANAAELPVLSRDGAVHPRVDPGVAALARADERPSRAHLRERARDDRPRAGARAARAPRRTVTTELRRLLAEGQIDDALYADRRATYAGFKRAVKRFSGRRRIDMAGVLGVVDGIAARGQLTPSRLPALWLTLERNREWWNLGPLLASGQRVSFEDSELVWQYVPGEGLQIHPLANFGKLNALWRSRRDTDRMAALLQELLPLPAQRAGGLAWEYYFDFGGGAPPWVSGLAQGTGLQAVARAAVKAGRGADVLPWLRSGLAIFRTAPPEGVAVAGEGGGTHFLQYSFAPGLEVLNGFVQSLVGLYDFARLAADPEAQALFAAGETSARAEVPAFDTGAWSLYSRGTSTHESNLNYHEVLRDFLASLCDRTADPVFCGAEANFTRYLGEGPQLALVSRRLRGGRAATLKFTLSKISRVTIRVARGRTVALSTTAVLAGGAKAVPLRVPRRAGSYAVSLQATDLAGNRGEASGTVRVLKPRR